MIRALAPLTWSCCRRCTSTRPAALCRTYTCSYSYDGCLSHFWPAISSDCCFCFCTVAPKPRTGLEYYIPSTIAQHTWFPRHDINYTQKIPQCIFPCPPKLCLVKILVLLRYATIYSTQGPILYTSRRREAIARSPAGRHATAAAPASQSEVSADCALATA